MAITVSQAAGCIITSDDGGSNYALITANWSLKSAAGQTLTCPPGTTTAAVYSQAVDTSYRLVGSPFIDLYDCDAGHGNSAPLPPDVYQEWVELTSEGGGSVYATSTSLNEAAGTEDYPDGWFVNVLDVDQEFRTTIYADGGYFQFDWNLVDTATERAARLHHGRGHQGRAAVDEHDQREQLVRRSVQVRAALRPVGSPRRGPVHARDLRRRWRRRGPRPDDRAAQQADHGAERRHRPRLDHGQGRLNRVTTAQVARPRAARAVRFLRRPPFSEARASLVSERAKVGG